MFVPFVQYYQQIKTYFTKGSFGVKFYPILMYPCIRHSRRIVIKLLAILSIFIGIDFFFAEFIAILFSRDSLSSYANHTIFSLSLPMNSVIEDRVLTFSPLSYVVRLSFLLQGYLFWLIYLFAITHINPNGKVITGGLAIIFSIGMAMIASAQGGQFTLGGLQNIGVSLTFLIGNIVMIIAGLTLKRQDLKFFKSFSLIGGLLGIITITFTLFEPIEYLPILERISLYAILIWEIIAGFAVLKQMK